MEYRTTSPADVAPFVAERILDQLRRGRRVLWLLSGGSGGAVCVAVSQLLAGHDLSGLFATMSDERYGELDHKDENMRALIDQGFLLPGATVYRPLTGADRPATTAAFADWLTRTSQSVDYRIAVMGIGSDGHTSGIKPHSPGLSHRGIAIDFEGEDFQRMTTTSAFLRTLDEAVVQAYGADKQPVLRRLLAGNGDEAVYPMMVIRDIPRVTIFSDNKEETA